MVSSGPYSKVFTIVIHYHHLSLVLLNALQLFEVPHEFVLFLSHKSFVVREGSVLVKEVRRPLEEGCRSLVPLLWLHWSRTALNGDARLGARGMLSYGLETRSLLCLGFKQSGSSQFFKSMGWQPQTWRYQLLIMKAYLGQRRWFQLGNVTKRYHSFGAL